MIVLDASVLIAHVEPSDAHHVAAAALLRSTAEQDLAVSPITLAGFFVAPASAGLLDAAEEIVRRLDLSVVPLDGDAPRRLARLRARTRLKMPDCCVLLAAQQIGAALASFDERLLVQARSLGLTTVEHP